MNVHEIQQAIKELSPDELVLLRHWLEEFERESEVRKLANLPTREKLKKLRGSLKGKGVLKAFMEERHKN